MSLVWAYDTAGNVKEWCFKTRILAVAISWAAPGTSRRTCLTISMYSPPFERSFNFGFRGARYAPTEATARAADTVNIEARDYSREKPVSDQVFKLYKGLFAYDKNA